jgi:ATP-dependent Lhr-like helicase
VSAVEKLDPLVQHHLVNTLGWRELRDLQEHSIEPILRGDHCLLLAPTAGGKTEAAVLPVLSRVCSERWEPLSVLYVCPLKALLNNLAVRLERYAGMVGRRSDLWHGDISASAKRGIRRDAPDILLTTPESLEVMLVSPDPEAREMLRSVRVVIVDEIHAFAGDDRGWHLLALLERVRVLAGRELQRIGLSATVGNPDELLVWLAGHCDGRRSVAQPESPRVADADVTIDYVGSLDNAAIVISRLHRGEKRLVFCDSRSQVEELVGLLRRNGVETYISHSSLSVEERRTAEAAFSNGSDCVIVATSTLELGIDVGDLDRVIQVDAPNTVASFLQRLGRTGRRPGQRRNCLFLAISERGLLRACAIVELWRSGFVEPVQSPARPLHVLAQQIMALTLQLQGIGVRDWRRWIGRLPPFATLSEAEARQILDYLVERRILHSDGVRLSLGDQAQADYGRRNFLELLSVFTTPPLLSVLCGQKELGSIDEVAVARRSNQEPAVLSLGGRSWLVQNIDWRSRRVFVEPAQTTGRTTWLGSSRGVSYAIARGVHALLTSKGVPEVWSRRTQEQITVLREEYAFLRPDADVILHDGDQGEQTWFTFAGTSLNLPLDQALERIGFEVCRIDDIGVTVRPSHLKQDLFAAIQELNAESVRAEFQPPAQLADTFKFGGCLPPPVLTEICRDRSVQVAFLTEVLQQPRHVVFTGK